MRRLLVVLGALALTLLTSGPASAAPPLGVSGPITDEVAALGAGTADARSAVEALAAEDGLGLHAVFVSGFDAMDAGDWAESTAQLSGLEETDMLLAVSVGEGTYEYGWWVDESFPLVEVEVEEVVSTQVEPRLEGGDWSGAVVTLADQLRALAVAEEEAAQEPQWSATQTLLVVGGIAVVLVAAHLLSRRRSSTGSS